MSDVVDALGDALRQWNNFARAYNRMATSKAVKTRAVDTLFNALQAVDIETRQSLVYEDDPDAMHTHGLRLIRVDEAKDAGGQSHE